MIHSFIGSILQKYSLKKAKISLILKRKKTSVLTILVSFSTLEIMAPSYSSKTSSIVNPCSQYQMGMKKMSKKPKDNIFHTFNCKRKIAYIEGSPCSITLIWDGWWWWGTFNGEVGEGWGGSFTWMGGPWKMGISSIEEGFYWMLLHDGSQPSFLAPPYLYSTLLKYFLPLIFPYYIQTFCFTNPTPKPIPNIIVMHTFLPLFPYNLWHSYLAINPSP